MTSGLNDFIDQMKTDRGFWCLVEPPDIIKRYTKKHNISEPIRGVPMYSVITKFIERSDRIIEICLPTNQLRNEGYKGIYIYDKKDVKFDFVGGRIEISLKEPLIIELDACDYMQVDGMKKIVNLEGKTVKIQSKQLSNNFVDLMIKTGYIGESEILMCNDLKVASVLPKAVCNVEENKEDIIEIKGDLTVFSYKS